MNYNEASKYEGVDFSTLKGKTITSITGLKQWSERVEIECADGSKYVMAHIDDCCEHVSLFDITGDVQDLLNNLILFAEASESGENTEYSSCTWTFYKLATIKGYVDVRWYGESSGYYSESVGFFEVKKADYAEVL